MSRLTDADVNLIPELGRLATYLDGAGEDEAADAVRRAVDLFGRLAAIIVERANR